MTHDPPNSALKFRLGQQESRYTRENLRKVERVDEAVGRAQAAGYVCHDDLPSPRELAAIRAAFHREAAHIRAVRAAIAKELAEDGA